MRAHVEALLDGGAARVVVGSVAAREPKTVREWIEAFGPERICVALDVRMSGAGVEVATDGWAAGSGRSLSEVLAAFPPGSVLHALVTDISRDGALTGPNVALMRQLRVERPDLHVQASGGVASLDDLRAVRDAGAAAAIVGRALYDKRFTLEDALAL